MGQLISHSASRPPTPPLLKLPIEMILAIASRLSSSPESIVALSLTCKSLFAALESHVANLGAEYREDLLVLLEKDLGARFFYCSTCRQLHQFTSSFTPLEPSALDYCFWDNSWCDCMGFFRPSLLSPYTVWYVHARLVMNRYLYGPPKGLPLESFAQPAWAPGSLDRGLLWLQTPSARIVQGELLIRFSHTLEGRASILRHAIDQGEYCICRHVATDSFKPSRTSQGRPFMIDLMEHRMPELRKPEEGNHGTEPDESLLFRPCRGLSRSCTKCSTDYTMTIERAEVREVREVREEVQQSCEEELEFSGPFADGWRVTIVAYHQLGRCRDSDDWEWLSLTGGDSIKLRADGRRKYSGRNMALYPPGSIIRKWEAGDGSLGQRTHL